MEHKNKGITLISLVITIIVLLILAGIVISLTIGENGIINRAKEAGDKYGQAQKNELSDLSNLEEQLEKYITGDILENKEDTDAGTIVQLPDTWAMQTMRQVLTGDGKDIVDSIKIATVYAVATGNGEQVPVPYGFWYVGGNFNTGVVISDNEVDSFLKNGKDMSSYEDSLNLLGNQFVWIPCALGDYKKSNTWNGTKQTTTTLANSYWDTNTNAAEKTQIQKYGGFYVGRYEAGLATTISEFETTQQHTKSNQVYNVRGTPQSKSGQIPWMFIDWTTAKANAESMYHTNYVGSGLITGTQWDVMLNTMVNKTVITASDLTNSSSWGNYRNTQISYKGRLAKAYYSNASWYLPVFGEKTVGTTSSYNSDGTYGDLLTTGASDTTQRYHLFDVAGNLAEWTEETSLYGGNVTTEYSVLRGSSYVNNSSTSPACYREGKFTVSHTGLGVGFRTVLYMK